MMRTMLTTALAIALLAPPAWAADSLQTLVQDAKAHHTGALLVQKDGQTVAELNGEALYPLYSLSKPIAGLAFGMLRQMDGLPGFDAPLWRWYGAFGTGPKSDITLRHILTQTTGLDNIRRLDRLGPPANRMAEVLKLPLVSKPGTDYDPSSEAQTLIAAVVRQSAGQPLDAFLGRFLFKPMGITRWSWPRDKGGTPDAELGLRLGARDLAAIGRLMLQEGLWDGKPLLPRSFVLEATSQQVPHENQGFMWSPLVVGCQTPDGRAKLAAAGFTAADKLAPLDGKPLYSPRYYDPSAYFKAAEPLLSADEFLALQQIVNLDRVQPLDEVADRESGYLAWGDGGQQLVVLPKAGVVAVRLRAIAPRSFDPVTDEDGFADFAGRLAALYDR